MNPTEVRDVSASLLRAWPLPKAGDDKESRGRALVVGGSRETPGAVLLSAEAALRAGAGKVQVVTVKSVATEVAVALPEALVRAVPETDEGEISIDGAQTILDLAEAADAVLIGPGMMRPPAATELLEALLPRLEVKVVLDAVALSVLSGNLHATRHLSGRCLLTPNEAEVARTLGIAQEDLEDGAASAALRLASSTGAVVTSGGATTWTATPEGQLWRDDAGGPGLGVAGSGDVRAGIILGVWARGSEPEQAAVWGAHVHARAGDRLAETVATLGFLARDLLAEVPRTLFSLEK
jgi:hydroxyethylthiazole kinase-like uncharacterized protein yjeF